MPLYTPVNLTGPITSVGNATSIAAQTGTGTTFVVSAAPTITGAANFSGTLAVGVLNNIIGTDGSGDAAAGNLGEYLSQVTSSNTNAGTSGNFFDGTASPLALTPGDWDVTYTAYFTANGATTTNVQMFIGTAAGNFSTGRNFGAAWQAPALPTAALDSSGAIPNFRVKITSNTNYYAKMALSYSVAIPQYQCRISARRVR